MPIVLIGSGSNNKKAEVDS